MLSGAAVPGMVLGEDVCRLESALHSLSSIYIHTYTLIIIGCCWVKYYRQCWQGWLGWAGWAGLAGSSVAPTRDIHRETLRRPCGCNDDGRNNIVERRDEERGNEEGRNENPFPGSVTLDDCATPSTATPLLPLSVPVPASLSLLPRTD